MRDVLHVGCIDSSVEHGWKRDEPLPLDLLRRIRLEYSTVFTVFPGLEVEVAQCCFRQVT